MNVRRRLVLAFVGVAALVLLLFVFVTYRAVLGLDAEENRKLLQGLALTAAQQLSDTPGELSEKSLAKVFPYDADLDTVALIVDKKHRLISNAPLDEFMDPDKNQTPIINLTSQQQTFGLYEAGDHTFHWVRAPISGRDASFLLLKHERARVSEYARTLVSRLMITAFFIIWIAIWVALLISNRIIRRLDQQNSALIHQALHDDLTGLPNRNQLFDHLQSRIDQDPKLPFSLLVIDINDFKEINDTLGHDAGDALLTKIGRSLAALTEGNMIARLGGDEFAFVLSCRTKAEIRNWVHKIQRCLQIPNDILGLDIVTSASIGCGSYPEHANSAQTLIQRAEVAMYRAKTEHAPYLIYDAGFDPHNVRRLSLMADVRNAIDNGQLSMYYQPKIDMKTGSISSVEALVRWQHPEYGLVPPDEFIGFIEQSDFVIDFTLFTIRQALIQCRNWHEMGLKIDVAVNLSANTLHDLQLPNEIRRLLAETGVAPDHLKLEVTESAIMADPELALRTLRILADMNITLSIDDFGTGHSSLVYLKRLPATELKIDRAFVMDMLNNENDRLIVRTIIELAHNLGYSVVAEGIEDAETYEHLKQKGCDTAQGYFVSRALPASEFDNWMEEAAWDARKAV